MAQPRFRRLFVATVALFAIAAATTAYAQMGGMGHPRNQGDSGSSRSSRQGDAGPRNATPPVFDPITAIERELPSLRIDLKLTAEQTPLFDSFEREVRNAAAAGRAATRHLSAFRTDDGSTVRGETVFGTIADDDTDRAESSRLALERMTTLYGALAPEQRKQFDRRIIQSLREPLGTT
jgi:hypothetical protein